MHYLAMRCAIGVVFLVAGCSKISLLFSHNYGVQNWIIGLMEDTWVPVWATTIGSYAMPLAELILGVTLFFGICTYLAATGGICMFVSFLFVAEFNHAEPGMLIDIIQQIVFVISMFLIAQYNPGEDEPLCLVKSYHLSQSDDF